jgi:hypothetical protein
VQWGSQSGEVGHPKKANGKKRRNIFLSIGTLSFLSYKVSATISSESR